MVRKVMLLLPLILSSFWSQAQNLDVYLPPETLVYVSVPTGKEWLQQYHHSALGQFLQEEEIRQLGEKILRRFDFAFQEMNRKIHHFCGKDLSEIMTILDGEVGFALIRMDPEFSEWIGSIGFSSLQEGKSLLQVCFSRMTAPERRHNEQGEWEVLSIEGLTLYFGWRENTLFFSLQENLLKTLLFENPPDPALPQLSTYQKFSQILGDRKSFRLWVNTQELWKQQSLQPTAPSQEMLSLLGIDQWTSLSLGLCFDELDLKWAYQIGTDGTPPRGLNLFLNPPSLPTTILNRLPQSLSSLSVSQFDSVAFYRWVRSLFLQTNPDSWNTIQGYLDVFEQSIQMSIEEVLSLSGSIFGTLSFEDAFGEQTVYCFYPENPSMWVEKTMKLFQGQMELVKKEYRGKEIYQMRVPLGQLDRGLGNILPTNIIQALKEIFAFPTAFYVDEDRIVSAHLPQILMDFIDAMEPQSALPPQITQVLSPDLASISWTPVGKKSLASCLTLMEVFNLFIPAIRVWTQIDISSFDLPRAETLVKHARPSFSYSRTGTTILSVSQINVIPTRLFDLGATTLIAGTGVIAAIAVPGLLRARVSANEASAIASLKTIATAQMIFQSLNRVDQDEDGTGEFGWIQELSGTIPSRGKTEIFSGELSPEFGETALKNGGIAEKSGYYFMLYLPTAQGNAARETSEITRDKKDSNPQELRWVCYAWPVNFGNTGNRTFMVNQTGQVYCSVNSSYSGLYMVPAPNAALETGAGSENLETHCTGLGVDGNYWSLPY